MPRGRVPLRGERRPREPLGGTSASGWAGGAQADGGDHVSHRVAQAELILAACQRQPTIFLRELRDQLAGRGFQASTSRTGPTSTRTASCSRRHRRFAPGRDGRDHHHGPPLRASAVRQALPFPRAARPPQDDHDHRCPATAALRIIGPAANASRFGEVAASMFEGATNGQRFRGCVADTLVPTLRPGGTVVLDTLCGHKVAGAREAVEAAGARLLFLPPCSPEFNPIGQAFAKLKALLRRAAARTTTDLHQATRHAFACFTPQECRNHVTATGREDDAAVTT